jgi:DNA-binding NtrC family response regulator
VPRLVRHFSGQDEAFDVLALESLIRYGWPFNVRELRQLVAKLLIESPCPIPFEALPAHVQFRPAGSLELVPSTARIVSGGPRGQESERPTDPRRTVPDRQVTRPTQLRPRPERQELVTLLEDHDWNVSEVARVMSRDRKQIYRWMEQYEIEAPTRPDMRPPPRKG